MRQKLLQDRKQKKGKSWGWEHYLKGYSYLFPKTFPYPIGVHKRTNFQMITPAPRSVQFIFIFFVFARGNIPE